MYRKGSLYDKSTLGGDTNEFDAENQSIANLVLGQDQVSNNNSNSIIDKSNDSDSGSLPDIPEDRRIRAKKCLSVILISWIIVAVVAGVLAFFWRNDEDPTPSPTPAPTPAPTLPTDSISPTTSFQAEVSSVIAPLYPDSPSPLQNDSSPQSKALTWMTYNNQILPKELQRYYIAVLYFSLEGNTWHNKTNWMIDDIPECDWYGIVCNYNSVVVKIDLSCNGLKGTIAREISLLTILSHLVMQDNQIGGLIPESIISLTSLRSLSLYSNNLHGEIPVGIGNLVDLQFLYLDDNMLQSTIPDSLWSLSELVDLTLNNNNLEGNISEEINLSKLERLWISNNTFTGSIPNTISAMPNMKYYYIDMNKFKGIIPDNFASHLPNLIDIRMSNNILEGCMPKDIFSMKNLEILYLNHNEFKCELFPEIYSGPLLSDLQIQSNGFYGSIPTASSYSYLAKLDMSQNKLSSSIPTTLGYLSTIKLLSFSENELIGTIPSIFGPAFKDIEYLRLSNNSLSGTIPDFGELYELHICEVQRANSAIIAADCTSENPLVSCDCCNNC